MIKKQQNKTKKKVPELRFGGFSSGWEEKKLGEVFEKSKKKNTELKYKKVLTNSAVSGIVNQIDFFDKEIANQKNINGYYIVKEGSFVYNPRISKYAPVGPLKRNKLYTGVMSPLYTILDMKADDSLDFFEHYFGTKKWHKWMYRIANYGARHDRMNILQDDFFNMPIFIPRKEEQKKIAGFLSVVDEWVENLKGQKEDLEKYKKGVMQKLFPAKGEQVPQLRFNGFTDNWEEKKLRKVGETFNGLSGKTKDDFGVGEPFITYKQIFDKSEIDLEKFAFVKIRENEKQNKAKFGDIFFTTSSETPQEVGFSSVLLNKNVEPFLNSFSFGFRPKSLEILDPYFAKYLFRSHPFRKEVVKLAQGSTRFNISKIGFLKIRIKLPSLSEQQKIASFLTSLDDIVESTDQKIIQAQKWKKGLIQRLFV